MKYLPGSTEHITAILMGAMEDTPWGSGDRTKWLHDPASWAKERARVTMWSKQLEIMESIRDNRRTAVRSAHSVGKTFTAAHAAGWWLDTHPPGTAFVLSTAPTGPQVKALLWKEVNRLHRRAELPGRTNQTEWYINDELVGFGRKPSEYNESAFQGVHAPFLLVILDEAGGVPETLWIAAEANAANKDSRILAIGNPDSLGTPFHSVSIGDPGWHTMRIGYEDTPAYTGEDVPQSLLDQLISPTWVEDMRVKWGEESALFSSKVLGEFPRSDVDVYKIVKHQWANACRHLDLETSADDIREVGIDVGAGDNHTVIVERVGMKVGRVEAFTTDDPVVTADRITAVLAAWAPTRARIDGIGVGWGIYGSLRERSAVHNPRGTRRHHAEMVSVRVADVAHAPKSYVNRRAELWWTIGRELSQNSLWDLANLPDDGIAELTSVRYEMVGPRIKVEPKDAIKKRIGRSTDYADALLLAFIGWNRTPASTGVSAFSQPTNVRGRTPFDVGNTSTGRGIFG